MESERSQALTITLVSGARYIVADVMLYHESSLRRVQWLQTEATKALGGSSLGLGVIGSPGWVLGGALALGALQQILDSSKSKQGAEQLQQAQALTESIRKEGVMVPIENIDNIRYPMPGLWRATVKRDLNNKIYDVQLAHNGEPFVQIKTSDGAMLFIAWDKVEQYAIQPVITL
jgi:hypothetical protein